MESVGVGSIKKIFGRQREPYGFLTIHHPEELRGDEAVFYLKDVIATEEERRLLQGGLMVKFVFTKKPVDRMKAPCPFKAVQVRPQDPMRYQGTVTRSSGGSLVVFLDILFRQVKVQQNHNQTVDPGDRCLVSVTWREIIRSIREDRDPVGTLLSIEKKYNSFFNEKYSTSYDTPYTPYSTYCWNPCGFYPNPAPTPRYECMNSIWADGPTSKSFIPEDPWEVDWFMQTLSITEKVLSGNSSRK